MNEYRTIHGFGKERLKDTRRNYSYGNENSYHNWRRKLQETVDTIN